MTEKIDWDKGAITPPAGATESIDWDKGEIKPPPKTRTWGEAASDVGVGLLQGGAGLVKTAGDAYGLATGNMNNAVSEAGKNAQEYWENQKSDALKERSAQRKANIDAQDTTLGKAWTAIKDTVTDPALAADVVATNAATMLPGAAVGRGMAFARMAQGARAAEAAGLTGEALTAATSAAARSAGKFGTAGAVGTGAAQQGADVASGGYDAAMEKTDAVWDANPDFQAALAANGGDRQAAKQQIALSSARAAFVPAAAVSVAANAIPGATYLERALVGGAARDVAGAGVKYAMPKAIAKGALGEGGQEFIEEGGGQLSANAANRHFVDPSQDLMQDVGENAGLGFAGGLLMGGAGGAFHGQRATPGSQQDQQNALNAANMASDAAVEGAPSVLEAQQWSTAPGAAPDGALGQTQAASPLYDPSIDGMSTSPGAAQAQGNEVDYTRDFDTAGLALASDAPAGPPAAPADAATGADLGAALDQRTPAQRMGLDENAGTMSAAAVLAVNSGAAGQLQAASAAAQQHDQNAAKGLQAGAKVKPEAPAPAVDADGHSFDDARMPELAPEEFTARQRRLNQELSVAMSNNDRPALSRIGDAKRELFNGSRSTADLMADYNAAEGSREATAKHEQRGIRDELGKRGLVVERQVQNDSGEVRFTAKPITQNTQQAPEPGIYATYEDARKARGEQNARGTSVKVIPSPVEGGFILAAKGTPEYAIGEQYAEQRRKQDSAANRQKMAESNAKYKAAADLAKHLKAEREGAQSAQAAAAPTLNPVQTTGETANGIEANQAQQADPKRIAPVGDGGSIAAKSAGPGARAPRIVAKGRPAPRPVDGSGGGQPAQGLIDGAATTANPGAKAAPAPGPQAQAQEPAQQRAQRLDDAGAVWTRIPAAERQGIAARLDGVKPVIARNLPSSQWKNLNGDLQRKIADAIAPAPVSDSENTQAPEPAGAPAVPAQPDAQAGATSEAVPAGESAAVSAAAHEAATSQRNDLAAPSEAQLDAGNYRKGHVRINGLDISIENPAGSKRRPEWPALKNHYGYLKGTVGADKDHVDVFLTDRAANADLPVFVVDQVNSDGTFDEHKVVLGADNETAARQTYLDNYAKGWTGLGAITEMSQDDFKAWARDPAKTKVPAGKLADVAPKAAAQETTATPAPKAPAKKTSRGVLAKVAEAQAARADYFTPGNIVKSYIGHDRVISYSPPDADGSWSVKVQAVEKKGDAWVDMPNERVRSHFTQPSARDLADGPVLRAETAPAVPTTEPAQAQSLLDRHTAMERAIGEGTLALADYQQTFDALTSDKAAVVAELSKLTKDDLLRAGGAMFAYRYKGDKKDVIVNAAYETMLHTYALGRQYGSNTWVMSAEGRRAHEAAQDAALRELVGNTTAEDLAAHAAEVKAARDEFKARREAAASALENPKSLQDFRGFMRHWIEAGDTADQAFLRLNTEQRQVYDALEAESTREAREKAKADARKANVQSAGETTAGEIIETKHTKHGHDLFVVQLADRVSREDYDTLNTSARGLGGAYSSFRGNGAVPGFQFRSRESAQAFQQLVAGDTAAAQSVAQARRDAFADDKSQTAVERLRTMAEAIDAEADAQLSVDRKTNTARRARMAGAAEEAARGSKAYAGTMRNLADAIEAGKALFLDGVRTKTQLTQLQQAIGAAKSNQLFAKHGSWAAAEEHKHSPADAQTVDFAEFPRFSMYRSDLAGLARQLLEIDGGKKLGASLAKVADDVTAAYTEWAKANLLQVSQFGAGGQVADFANKADAERAIKRSGLVGKAVVLAVKRGQNRVVLSPGEAMQRGLWQGDGDKRINLSMDFVQDLVKLGKRRGNSTMSIPWQLESTLEKRQRLQRMGIQTPAEYRSALRELVNLREDAAAPDRVKELERSMVGRQNDGLDFFPTPTAVTENAVEAADIQPGMEVLEPSAGMGHIADYIREQSGVEPDVVELSGKRRELLEAKGYDLVGFDFLDVNTKQYDRIVMNPPFSDGRDIQHVQHAYSLLKPGGRLVAIMGEGAFFQSNKRAEAFRDWLGSVNATNEKLPEGSFMNPSLPVNTGVAARMVVVDKPAGAAEPADVNFGRERESSAVGSATDRALMDMVREGKPAQDLLQLIAGTSKSRFNKQVARLLTKAKVSPTVVLEAGALGGDGNFTFLARYRRSNDTVGLTAGAQAQAEQILLHEMIHAATLKALDRKGVASLQMRKLYEHVKKQGGANAAYGMKNVGEFVAEAFTNPEFQRQLKQMSAPQGNVLKSAWDSLVRILHTILGLPVDSTNALSQALTLGVEVMRENVALRRRQDASVAAKKPEVRYRTENTGQSNQAEGKPFSVAQAEAIVQGLRKSAPFLKGVQVVSDPSQVPEIASDWDPSIQAIPKGATLSTGEVYIFAGGHSSKLDLIQTVFHELFHSGVLRLGDGNVHYNTMVQMAKSDPRVEQGAKAWRETEVGRAQMDAIREANPGRSDNWVTQLHYAVSVEESLAEISEDLTRNRMVGTRRTVLVRRLSVALSRIADSLGFHGLAAHIRSLNLTQTERFVLDTISMASPGNITPFNGPANGPAVRYRATATEKKDGLGAAATAIKDGAMAYVHDAMNQAPGTVHWWHKTVGTMNNLAERNPAFKPVFDAAQQFTDDVSSLANDVANLAPRLIPRLETVGDLKFWGKDARKPISGQDNTAIAKPLFEGTLMWTRDIHGKPVSVDALQKETDTWDTSTKEHYLIATKELSAAQARAWQGLPLAQYEKLVTDAFQSKVLKPGIRWSDAELRSMFKLTDGQLSLFKEARSTIDASIDTTARADMMRMLGEEYRDMREAVMEAPTLDDALTLVTRTLQDEAKANPDNSDRLMELHNSVVAGATKARDLVDKGYAPLSRFGSHTVDVLDAKGERLYFGLFETAREADAMQANLAEVYKDEPGVQIGRGTLSKEEYKLFAGVTPESLEAFGNMLGLEFEGNEAKDAAFQEYIRRTKNNHSALKRLIHRKGIAGYSQDVGRVLASFVYSNARQGAGALNAGTMEKAIQEIPKQQGQLRDVAMGLRSYIQDPQEEGQAVRGFLFAQYLGGSVASAVVNMLQPVQITFPWLSQYGGVKQAGAQLTRAFKDMATVGKTYEPDLAKALKRAEDEGTVSPQEIHQLMAQARGEASLRAGDGTALGNAKATASNAWRRTVVAWGQPFAWAEQLNRRSTFIAAYRIAVAEKMADPDAFAAKAVKETQFQYSKANKMRWGRGAIGGTLMTFKSYSVSYLELMGRMWNAGEPGSPQRAESRKALVLMVAMLALMGGAGGLPFVEDVEDLVNGLMNKMGYNWDSKQARKQFLQQVLGQAGAEFINSGISGLPGMPIDVAGRLGMGNLIPGTGLVGPQTDKSRDLLELVGPAGDFAKRIFNAAGMALGGSIGGAALEASPGAVRNAVKGVDMATSGMYKDGRGYKVIDTNLGEALSKFIGFQPRAVADVQEANGAMQKSRSFYTLQSSEIKAQWADALFRKDDAALERVRERLASWNRKNPEMPIVVKIPEIMKKVREMGKDKQQRIADTAPKALRQQMREMAQEASR